MESYLCDLAPFAWRCTRQGGSLSSCERLRRAGCTSDFHGLKGWKGLVKNNRSCPIACYCMNTGAPTMGATAVCPETQQSFPGDRNQIQTLRAQVKLSAHVPVGGQDRGGGLRVRAFHVGAAASMREHKQTNQDSIQTTFIQGSQRCFAPCSRLSEKKLRFFTHRGDVGLRKSLCTRNQADGEIAPESRLLSCDNTTECFQLYNSRTMGSYVRTHVVDVLARTLKGHIALPR